MQRTFGAQCIRSAIWGGLFASLLLLQGARLAGEDDSPAPGISAERDASQDLAVPVALAQAEAAADAIAHPPVDPIAANGPIFVDWPQPDLALLFSGPQNGFLEPCGCAGLENQKGGLMRRHTLIKQLQQRGWPVAAMDLGGMVRRFGTQAEIKYQYSLTALQQLAYDAVGLGAPDLRMDLLPIVINLDAQTNPLVSANVGILDFDSEYTKRFTVIERGGFRIGVTSVLGARHVARLERTEDLKVVEPNQAIPQILPELLAENCDQLVLLVYADKDEAETLARRFPDFDWVVVAEGADEPPATSEQLSGQPTQLVEVGHKGMYVVVVGLYQDGSVPFRYQRVPLDHRFEDSPEMHQIMVDYQEDLELRGLEGLNVKALNHPSGLLFAGTNVCADCHTSAHETFEHTPHAHATQRLVDLDPPRHFDPECLSCHVTGWEPQKYYPFRSGYLGLDQTPHLVANGCENCYGPAAKHAAAELGEIEVTQAEQEALRDGVRLKIVENEGNQQGQEFGKVAQMCIQCHDKDNSPDFDFQTYWPEVEHQGMD